MSKIATLCGEWTLEFHVPIETEELPVKKRSYLHYIAAKPDILSSKCWATKWLLQDACKREVTIKEYLAGVGLVSTILQGMFNVRRHVVNEINQKCVTQLRCDGRFTVTHKDCRKVMKREGENFDIKCFDFPHSSIIQIKRGKWSPGFLKAFDTHPDIVIWTDTSVVYHINVHGPKYAKELDVEKVESHDHYFELISNWLFESVGYSIDKVAYRGKNAAYIKAVPKKPEPISFKHFPLDIPDGFKLEER